VVAIIVTPVVIVVITDPSQPPDPDSVAQVVSTVTDAPPASPGPAEPDPRGPRHRKTRRWPHRLLVGSCIFVGICLLAAGGTYGYIVWRLGNVARIRLPNLTADKPGTPMNVLLVGSDSRANLTGQDAKQAGKGRADTTGQRSDTIIVLHIDPGSKKAAILSIPRDLVVPIAGTNQLGRINSAFTDAGNGKGPQRLIDTIQNALGIQINHYAEVDFVGFKGIVDTVGGVSIYVPTPVRDTFSGLNIKNPGCIRFNGEQALQWVRSRHYEYYEAGRWHEDTRADIGRIQRQQDFIRRVLKRAVSTGLTNPLELNALVANGTKYLTIDKALSTKDMTSLASRFRSLNPDTVDMLTLPTEGRIVGGQYTGEKLIQPQAQQLIDRVNGKSAASTGAPIGVKPAEVRLRVLNGTGADGLAGKVSTSLEGVGYNIAQRGDADNFRYSKTTIRYAPTALVKAQLLQASLTGGATLVADSTLRDVDVSLIVGSDYTGVKTPPATVGSTASSAPTTTPPTTAANPIPTPKGAPPAPSC
jgi:LCP family protein required for cell wall assembly